ncbi:MAG: 16S rRNA (guanine(966)-N(2))-methyltransferase RsmD, partial [Actinobacteria bacterium]|nr:16S rRNA (guanine(966)-N(2))-methyltransferase RsmD [Actinomycetota bacterium]
MRIIAGEFKGKKLKIPEDYDIRPTQDRVKESIFNVLGETIINRKVLDLFSGSGSLGIEALSRGCQFAYFVDNSFKSINLIKKNLELLKNLERSCKIIKSDAVDFLKKNKSIIWDFIFVDPPYKIESRVISEICGIFSEKNITDKNTVIIYEFFFKRD